MNTHFALHLYERKKQQRKCLVCNHSKEWGLRMSSFFREASYHHFGLNPEKSVPHKSGFSVHCGEFHWAGGTDHRSLLCLSGLGITQAFQRFTSFPWNLKNESHLRTWVHIRWGTKLLSIRRRTQCKKAGYAVLCIWHWLFEWLIFPLVFSRLCKGWKGTNLLIWKPLENSCLAKARMVFLLSSSPTAHLLEWNNLRHPGFYSFFFLFDNLLCSIQSHLLSFLQYGSVKSNTSNGTLCTPGHQEHPNEAGSRHLLLAVCR